MTLGVGGASPEQALAKLQVMTAGASPIALEEYQARIARLQRLMQAREISAEALALGPSSSAAETYARVRERLVEKMPRLEELRAFFA